MDSAAATEAGSPESHEIIVSTNLNAFQHSPEAAAKAYAIFLAWFQQMGLTPDKAAITGPGFTGRYISFRQAHARLQKSGFAGVTYIQLEASPPESDRLGPWAEAVYSSSWQSISLSARAAFAGLSADSMLVPMKALIEATHPEWGSAQIYDHRPGRMDPEFFDRDYQRGTQWNNLRAWRHGLLVSVDRWNFLSEVQLSHPIEGMPLRKWIEAAPGRGELSEQPNGLTLWSIGQDKLYAVRDQVKNNSDMIFDLDKHLAKLQALEPPPPKPVPPPPKVIKDHKAKLVKRNRLVAKVAALAGEEPESYVLAVLALDEFFDGNWDEYSLAPNHADHKRPKLAECQRILAAIRERNDVQDVLVAIREMPFPDEPDDNDMWLESECVYILTSCGVKDVRGWTKALVPDEVNKMGKKWLTDSPESPPGAPELKPGMSVYTLWWD